MQNTRKKPRLWKYLRSVTAMALAMVLCLSAVHMVAPASTEAEAASTVKLVQIQTTVDPSAWQIVSGVIHEKTSNIEHGDIDLGWAAGLETRRLGSEKMRALEEAGDSLGAATSYLAALSPEDDTTDHKNDSYYAILTFPNEGTMLTLTSYTAEDEINAINCNNTLVYDLNNAFSFSNGGFYVPLTGTDVNSKLVCYKNDMVKFLEKVEAVRGKDSNLVTTYTASNGTQATLYGTGTGDTVSIKVGEAVQTFTFQWAKGYSNGLQKINWAHIALEAFNNYWIDVDELRVTPENVHTDGEPTDFEKLLINLFNSLANQIKSMLGLWDIDHLVFNFGGRKAPVYAGGIYPASWEKTVWTLFFVAEIASFLMLAIALLTNVLRKLMSTVNPILRTSLMDQAQNLLVVAFALGMLPLLIQLVVNTSSTITGIMGDAIMEGTFNDRFKLLSGQSGALGGIIMQFLYLAITISFNVLYIIRSYMVAMLIIISPIFVMFFAMGDNKKMLGKLWLSELLSNIFIQPIHAFVLGTVLLLPASFRPVEALVMLYCVLPISNVIRSLFFGNAGASPLRTAQAGIKAFRGNTQTAFKTTGAAVGAVAGLGEKLFSTGKSGKSGSKSEGQSDKSNAGSGEAKTGDPAIPSSMVHRNGTQGTGGPPVYASQGKTPKEQMADNIKTTGQIPSMGMDAPGDGGPADGQFNGKDVFGGAIAGAAVGGVIGEGMDSGEHYAVSRGAGSDMSGVIRSMPKEDGTAQYQVTRNDMRDAGFDSFQAKFGGGSKFVTTDTGYRGTSADGEHSVLNTGRSAYSEVDAKNYADMAQVFAHGTDAQKQALRQAGFDFVGAEMKGDTPTGRFTVHTNKNFQSTMGYQPTARKDGGLNIQRASDATGEMPRTPDVERIINPEAYKRFGDGGKVGYTATGMALKTDAPQNPTTMPISQGVSQKDGSYEIPAAAIQEMGMTVSPTESGHVAVTYDAGIMGQDDDGATVYDTESPMAMPDRQNVAQIQRMWEHGSDADREWLNSQGVEAVMVQQEEGAVTIVYNDAAEQSMGGRISASEDGHVVVQPTAPDVPVQTVVPIQAQPVQASSEPHVVVPTQAPGNAYTAEQVVNSKVTPMQVTVAPTPEPAQVTVKAPEPQPVTLAPPAPTPVSSSPISPPPVVTQERREPEPFMGDPGKPGANQRMQRRQNEAKHKNKGKKDKWN